MNSKFMSSKGHKIRANLSFMPLFTSKELLDHHIARVHELRNCETCPHCNKQLSRLKAHLQICRARWSEAERRRFKCSNENCDKIYQDKSTLNKHIKICPKNDPEEGLK